MQSSPASHHFPLRSKYSPQHPVLRHPQSLFFPYCEGQVSHPDKITGKIVFFYILIFKFLERIQEDKRFWTEWLQAFPEFNLLLIPSRIKLWCLIGQLIPYSVWTNPCTSPFSHCILSSFIWCIIKIVLQLSISITMITLAVSYGLDDGGSILGRDREQFFLFSSPSTPALGPNPTSHKLGAGGSSAGIKRPGREADHSPSSSAEMKNTWSYTSIPPYVFIVWRLIKQRDAASWRSTTLSTRPTLSFTFITISFLPKILSCLRHNLPFLSTKRKHHLFIPSGYTYKSFVFSANDAILVQ
jgi:hypothetical protein